MAPQLWGSYLVDMLQGATDFSVDANLVDNGLQQISLAGTAELELGNLLGTPPYSVLRLPATSVLWDDGSTSASTPGTPGESHMIVLSPVTPQTVGLSPTPQRIPLATTWMQSLS